MLADRHDWQAPFSGELVAALACEQLLGLAAPPRAVWLRTLLAELARITSHLSFLTWVPFAAGDAALASSIRAAREAGRELMLELSGNRLHPMLNRLGGLAGDASPEWLQRAVSLADRAAALEIGETLASLALAEGLGRITREHVHQFGISGPAARATGLNWDLRRRPGYLAYSELGMTEQHGGQDAANPPNSGDANARFSELVCNISHSALLVRRVAERLDDLDGPVATKLTRIIKLPDAETWLGIEAPLGVAAIHVVSRGGTTPWRFKLRTPTFAQVNVLQQALVGVPTEKAPAVIASFGYTIGDLDK
ncbi:NADH-quinone oxidoreductase subunit D [Propionibacteriaceae bacterium G57]|uniref:NADH-quinone oxidoreductase subunit D-related protein n=1 Tax=Aestuariimicrobium sp. G57 TaxID=3418485 RepID=UPI003DA70BCD